MIDEDDERFNSEAGVECDIKIRYAATPAKGRVLKGNNNNILVIFDEPQKSVTPGQSAVFYDDDIVLGGGKIKNILT